MTLDFYKLWASQIFSQVTANMLAFVLLIRVFELTRSSTAVGLVMFVFTLPSLLLGLFAGVLVDRWNKRTVLVLTNVLQGLVILMFLFIGDKLWPIYTLVFLYSVIDEFFTPAESSLMPLLVHKKDLPTANSLFFFTANSALFVGYSIGGPLFKYFGLRETAAVGAAFLFLAALATLFLPRKEPLNNHHSGNNVEGVIKDFKSGFDFVRRRKKILYPFLFYNGMAMLVVSTVVMFPQYATEILKVSLGNSGLVLVIPAGLGALSGAVLVGRLIPCLGRRLTILAALLVSALVIFALAGVVPYVSFRVVLAALLIYVVGMMMILATAPVLSFIQEYTPHGFRARVLGSLSATATWSGGLPVLISATLADILGVRKVLLLIGVAVLVAIYYLRKEKYMNLSLRED